MSFLARGPGLMWQREYPVLEKCPHCERTNITRSVRTQETCGHDSCKSKHGAAREKAKRAAKRKRQAA